MNNITTSEFEHKITNAKNLEELQEIISQLPNIPYGIRLEELSEEYGMTLSQIHINSGISKSLFYAMKNGTRKPHKPSIIRIGVAMGLSIEHLNELLKLANQKELYAKNKDDAIIIFGLKNKLKDYEIEELLIEKGETLRLFEPIKE